MKVKFVDQKEFDSALNASVLEVAGDQFYFLSADGKEIALSDNKWVDGERFAITGPGEGDILNPSATVQVRDGKNPALFLLDTGTDEAGKSAVKLNLKTRAGQRIDLSEFYGRLKALGIEDFNISSATVINDKIVLSNGGSADEPSGMLIVTDVDFWKKQKSADIHISHLQWEKQTGSPVEVSAIFYSWQNDLLFAAGNSAIDQGSSESDTILGIVENAYRKIDRKRIKVNEIYNLAEANEIFKNRTIKAMGAQDEKGEKIKLHLVALATGGESSLVKLRIKAN